MSAILHSSQSCKAEHDPLALTLTVGVTIGLILSYLPQHYRIISNRSSEGFSPWFLLLGSTSSAAAMLNVIALQWNVIKCCREINAGSCLESLGGVFQVVIQWALFTVILVLFLIYFPVHLKYAEVTSDPLHQFPKPFRVLGIASHRETTAEWRLGVTLSAVVAVHIAFCTFVTFLLILQSSPSSTVLSTWATFLGVSSAILAGCQFLPQIKKTWNTKLVGSLSIATMCIQSPGAAVMCLSIAIRPGTNWTSWATYAASGMLQSVLLVMCLLWKKRQARLGIDDFGAPLDESDNTSVTVVVNGRSDGGDERTPLLNAGTGREYEDE